MAHDERNSILSSDETAWLCNPDHKADGRGVVGSIFEISIRLGRELAVFRWGRIHRKSSRQGCRIERREYTLAIVH